jgi:hypothetical protein
MAQYSLDQVGVGSRILVYDYREFINDKVTPVRMLMKSAIVVRRYGRTTDYGSGTVYYDDMVDVVFDHSDDYVSKGHFTDGIELIEKQENFH